MIESKKRISRIIVVMIGASEALLRIAPSLPIVRTRVSTK